VLFEGLLLISQQVKVLVKVMAMEAQQATMAEAAPRRTGTVAALHRMEMVAEAPQTTMVEAAL
jgi:hypothetical protein